MTDEITDQAYLIIFTWKACFITGADVFYAYSFLPVTQTRIICCIYNNVNSFSILCHLLKQKISHEQSTFNLLNIKFCREKIKPYVLVVLAKAE